MNTESIVPAVFNFNSHDIRVTDRNGDPLFVAKDAAELLGYADPTNAIKLHCKGVAIYHPLETPGGVQNVRFITESDLYRLIIGSKLPAAVEFEKHVMEVILPAIRKTGGYKVPATQVEALRMAADALEQNAKLQLVIEQQKPAVEFVDQYVNAEGLFGIRQTAKVLGLQQNAFTARCTGEGVLYRESGQLVPYAKWLEAGYFQVKTGAANEHAFKQTRFTAKGMEWIRRYLKLGEAAA